VRYDEVVAASARLSATPKRSEKVATIAALLVHASPDEVLAVVGMLVGAPRQGRLGVGWAALRDARVAPAAATTVTVAEVDDVLTQLAATSGVGSQRERDGLLAHLLGRLTDDEQQHLVRLLTGGLRQGALDGVVSDGIARAADVPVAVLRRATMLLGDLGEAARRALAGEPLADIGLQPLVAVQPMLAATSASVTEAVAETGPASVEWKLDGMRVQAHKLGDDVRLFSRGLNDVTGSFPNVVAAVRELPVRDAVLDGESLAFGDDGRPHRFQDVMSGLGGTNAWFFDILHADSTSLIDEPLSVRQRMLHQVVPRQWQLPSLQTDDPVAAEAFAEGALAAGHEGVVVKALDSPYQAGRRGATWRKVKPVRTLDLVVLAAEWGHGRRTGWLSNLHLGARGSDGSFVMVGKTFKGMTDELLRWQTAELQARAIGTEGITVHVRPELVVEIALDGVQVSRRYPGGVALRFARVKGYRPDKRPDEADTIERVQGFL
jgi:DNA ligase-1